MALRTSRQQATLDSYTTVRQREAAYYAATARRRRPRWHAAIVVTPYKPNRKQRRAQEKARDLQIKSLKEKK